MALAASRRLSRPEHMAQPAEQAIADAATELYQACQLPRPVVIVAPDPIRFARIAGAFARSRGAEMFGLSAFAGLHLIMLVDSIFGRNGSALFSFLASLIFAPILYIMTAPLTREGPSILKMLGQSLVVLATTGLAVLCSKLVGFNGQSAAAAAGATAAGTVLVMILLRMVGPVLARTKAYRDYGAGRRSFPVWKALLHSRLANGIITRRLESALLDGTAVRGRTGPIDSSSLLRGHRERSVHNEIETEFRRIDSTIRTDMPIGQCVGLHFQTPAFISHLAVHRADPDKLPRVLQAAIKLDRLADAVFVFQDVAVVLPARSPREAADQVATSPNGWRRSRRAPWRQVLARFDDDFGLALAIDMAPASIVADWLIARRILRVSEAAERTPAIQMMGVQRFARAIVSKPHAEDESGQLHHFGRSEDPSVFVRVRDKVLGVNGKPLTHWISVPPHMASAREAVAWSFGMSAAEYAPARES